MHTDKVISLVLVGLAVVIFFGCTLPGFMHVTGLHKNNKVGIICLGLGVLLVIQLLSALMMSAFGSCWCKDCKSKKK